MSDLHGSVEEHYGVGGVMPSILQALTALGKDLDALEPADLAPVDEFHIRGREATIELAEHARLESGLEVLDLGSGLGGSARYLAAQYGCQVTGVDVTDEYVEAASTLARMVGLEERVRFLQGSALELPFDEGTFDAVWTEHVQMNIADKESFYRESHRMLKPGGVLLFHDIFLGETGDPRYPVPWADDASISFLAPTSAIREVLAKVGLRVREWENTSQRSLEWFLRTLEQRKESGPPPLGIHLLMGANAASKLANMIENLKEGRITVVQAVVERV